MLWLQPARAGACCQACAAPCRQRTVLLQAACNGRRMLHWQKQHKHGCLSHQLDVQPALSSLLLQASRQHKWSLAHKRTAQPNQQWPSTQQPLQQLQAHSPSEHHKLLDRDFLHLRQGRPGHHFAPSDRKEREMQEHDDLNSLQEASTSCRTCAVQLDNLWSSGRRRRAPRTTSRWLLMRRAAQLLRQRRHGHQAHTQSQQG